MSDAPSLRVLDRHLWMTQALWTDRGTRQAFPDEMPANVVLPTWQKGHL